MMRGPSALSPSVHLHQGSHASEPREISPLIALPVSQAPPPSNSHVGQ